MKSTKTKTKFAKWAQKQLGESGRKYKWTYKYINRNYQTRKTKEGKKKGKKNKTKELCVTCI